MVNLLKYQPVFYKKSAFVKAINSVIETELNLLQEARKNMILEARASTAVKYLPIHEASVNLKPNLNLTIAQRQSRALARKRQMDTTTKERIKVIVESFVNGEVEVIEESAEYTVTIDFVSIMGQPDNMEGIIEQLDRLMPAHLLVNYKYKWRTWAALYESGLTWKEIYEKGYTWRDLMEREVL